MLTELSSRPGGMHERLRARVLWRVLVESVEQTEQEPSERGFDALLELDNLATTLGVPASTPALQCIVRGSSLVLDVKLTRLQSCAPSCASASFAASRPATTSRSLCKRWLTSLTPRTVS